MKRVPKPESKPVGTPVTSEPLLAEVLAAPESDGPRLVLADWLQQSGDPRGEFIAVQCALAAMPAGDPRAVALEAREYALLSAHRALWLQQLGLYADERVFPRGRAERESRIAHVEALGLATDEGEFRR